MAKLSFPEIKFTLEQVKHMSKQLMESCDVGHPDAPELNYAEYIDDYLNILRATLELRAVELEFIDD